MDNLFTAITYLFVGSAIFLIGMNLMTSGLKKSTGKGVKKLFKKIQNSRIAGIGIGAAITGLIQSSAATCIMTIGFVATGAMTLYQSFSIVMGAFLGTTVTGLLVSLSSFSISNYLMLLAFIGVVMMFFKNDLVKNLGEIFAGLGTLFFGLEALKDGFAYEQINTFCSNLFTSVDFPPLLLLIGVVITAMVQSSSATIGIIIVMISNNALDFASGIYIAIGATIGSVVTTLLATIGSNTNAKRVGFFALFNRIVSGLIGIIVFWIFETPLTNFFTTSFSSNGFALALFTIIYNIISIIIFFPLIKYVVKLSEIVIKDKDEIKQKQALKYIDDHILKTPSLALLQTKKEIENMANLAMENFNLGYNMMMNLDTSRINELNEKESSIDYINLSITNYLIKLSPGLDVTQEKIVGGYFHTINDIERIGDHASNFAIMATQMKEEDLSFSDNSKEELLEMYNIVNTMYTLAIKLFDVHRNNNTELINELHDLESKCDMLKDQLSTAHYKRLKNEECVIEISPFYTSLVSELERIADHLTNIGYSFIIPTGDDPIE